jgi:uncharacterized protein YjeT (DUF2065 family)
MLFLLKFIGLYVVVMGIIFLLGPNMLKKLVSSWVRGKRLYLIGVLRLVIGAIFLMTAARCRLPGMIKILGILIIIKGILVFVIGKERIKTIISWWQKSSLSFIRIMGLIAIVFGWLIIYSV